MFNKGKRVTVHYVGTFDDGTKFDSTYDRGKPLTYTCLDAQTIVGFDLAVSDMEVGEKKTIRLAPEMAYGRRDMNLIQTVPIESIPGSENLEVGQHSILIAKNGQPFRVLVIDKNVTSITLDMNHDLAGKILNFEIELLAVEDNPEAEAEDSPSLSLVEDEKDESPDTTEDKADEPSEEDAE